MFDGTNPDGWILRAERYFAFYRLNEAEKIEAAVVGFDGDALLWYQWENRRRPIQNWNELRRLILQQFRPLHSGSLYEQWLAVKQTGSVAEFRRTFIEMAAPLEKVRESILMGHFVNGLREDIRDEVRMLGLYNLEQAMDLALKVEEKNRVKTQGGMLSVPAITRPNSFSQFSFSAKSQSHPQSTVGGANGSKIVSWSSNSESGSTSPSLWSQSNHSASPTSSTSPKTFKQIIPIAKPVGEIRRLTDKELQYKRERGLCFRCDDKWVAGHRCKRRELSVLLTQEDEDEQPISEEDKNNCEEVLEPINSVVSLNSVVGLTSPKTMKVKGRIAGQDVIVMIDPGATHNFISLSTVKKLGIPVDESRGFGVSLGNGEEVKGAEEYKGVLL